MGNFLMIPYDIARNTEFLKWAGTAEFKIWLNLVSYVIRKSNKNGFSRVLYDKYYVRGKLVTRWNQKDIAKNVGLKSPGHVSNLLSSMDYKGIIIKHKEPWNGNMLCVYEFGTHNGSDENYHMFNYFRRKNGKNTLINLELLRNFETGGFGISETIIE
jgi:hypothetical protein